jgi:aminoglycoside phosphotransferase (APT) family kinase protein
MTETSGIDVEPVTEWFRAHAPGVAPPLSFTLIAGGHSNLTYRVDDQAGASWALRRPPLGPVLATAHDMGREHRILAALAPTSVPVPTPIGLCTDVEVNGAPFYVMEFVDGVVVRDIAAAEALTVAQRAHASRSVIDGLVGIHSVDVDAVGLGELARREGYIERQLKRWRTQYEATKTRELPAMARVHEILSEHVPAQGPAGIVHGDYRLDNCILAEDGSVLAVLDWELCTLGDVLADLGQLLVYWVDPDDDQSALDSPPTSVGGFWTRDEVIEHYATASGRDVSQLDFYIAFAAWKVACILDGVHARYLSGAMGESRPNFDLESFTRRVEVLSARAESVAVRL